MKLQKKFFSVLVGLSTISVGLLLASAIQVFVEDKAIYIRESQLENAQVLSKNILFKFENEKAFGEGVALQFDELKSENYRMKLLLDDQGKVLYSSGSRLMREIKDIREFLDTESVERLLDPAINEASFETEVMGEPGILSFVRIPQKKMTVVLESPRKSVLRASLVFIIRGIVTLLGLVLSAILLSYILARSMTKGLAKLEQAMRSFGDGDLNSHCAILGNDEIGKMGDYFSRMALDIRRLFDSHSEKVKLEFEMATASELQSHFFPSSDFSRPEIEFSGFYQPSSHCGGDWWFYFIKDDQFVVFVGDVSGHGMKSALMTSAARAVFGLIEENFIDTSSAMNLLNRSFHAAAVGEVNMSALMFSVNMKTGEFEFTNASHDPALVWTSGNFPVGIADLVFEEANVKGFYLSESHGQRLGTRSESDYGKSKIKLAEGTIIFATTDGLVELENEKKRKFGDKQLLQFFSRMQVKDAKPLHLVRDQFVNELSQFGKNFYQLEDDLSFVFVRVNAFSKKD